MKQISLFTLLCLLSFSLCAQSENTKAIPQRNVIASYRLEVTFDKTVHLIFPSTVSYIDLGSSNIIAGKATGAENVVRVKAAAINFRDETNFSVITNDGKFYSFIVVYSDKPEKLSIEMNAIEEDCKKETSENTGCVYFSELGEINPEKIQTTMKKICNHKAVCEKQVKSKKFGIEFSLKEIRSYNGFLFFHTEIKNLSEIPFNVDFMTFKIADKKVAKRTAVQETYKKPIRTYNQPTHVFKTTPVNSVFAFKNFTIPDKKQLVIELFEKDGGRNLRLVVKNKYLLKALSMIKL